MASLKAKRLKGGTAWSVVYYLEKRQKIIYLGICSKTWATEVRDIVGKLVKSSETGEPVRKSVQYWLEEAGPKLRKKLNEVCLFDAPIRGYLTLGQVFGEYLQERERDLKPKTIQVQKNSFGRFLDFVSEDYFLAKVTPEQAMEFRLSLQKTMAEATAAGIIRDLKTFFNWTVRKGYLTDSPFRYITKGSFSNESRRTYISMEWYERLLSVCPDQEWRTILALARIGGLRTPSETFALRWSDIDFEGGSFVVHSSKTERFAGKGSRIVPLFPELRKELGDQFDLAEEGGSPYVISERRSQTASYLWRGFNRIIERSGLEKWPSIFQNLRVSRSNEILREYGPVCESRWIGHSERVAQTNYSLVLKEEFQRAVRTAAGYSDSSPSRQIYDEVAKNPSLEKTLR